MRTSTVLFLVVFLCVVSSERRREKVLGFFDRVGDKISSAVDKAGSGHCGMRIRISSSEDVKSHDLRDRLREAERRDTATATAVRTLERGLKSLTDKARGLREELADSGAGDVVERTLDALAHQESELKQELADLNSVRAQLQGEVARLHAELDLTGVRAERAETERFLAPTQSDRPSALDGLAATGR